MNLKYYYNYVKGHIKKLLRKTAQKFIWKKKKNQQNNKPRYKLAFFPLKLNCIADVSIHLIRFEWMHFQQYGK